MTWHTKIAPTGCRCDHCGAPIPAHRQLVIVAPDGHTRLCIDCAVEDITPDTRQRRQP